MLVKDDILQDRAEADGVVDLGLAALLETDALGVAAALDVEHTIVAPAVLVIANQRPRRVCRKRCLASTCGPCRGTTLNNAPKLLTMKGQHNPKTYMHACSSRFRKGPSTYL